MNFKFGVLLILMGMFIMSYLSCKKAFDREELINESLLRLAPRNRVNLPQRPNVPKSRTRKRSFIPPESEIRITPKDPKKKLEDVINLDYDVYGWTFRPGIAAGILPAFLGLDAKFVFVNKLGINGGFAYRFDYPNKGISPFASISYRLDNDYIHNTEVFGGIMALPRTTGIIGVRVNL